MQKETDAVIILLIMTILVVIDAITTILQITKKGIFISRKEILLKKTCKELRQMLYGVKRTSGLKKIELVNLIIQAA